MGHDKKHIEQMKAINYSLGNLKDCFRAAMMKVKTRTTTHSGGLRQHIPHRRSKLTMCLKDVFDSIVDSRESASSGGSRHEPAKGCALLVAHLSPLRSAGKHNENTMSFLQSLLERLEFLV